MDNYSVLTSTLSLLTENDFFVIYDEDINETPLYGIFKVVKPKIEFKPTKHYHSRIATILINSIPKMVEIEDIITKKRYRIKEKTIVIQLDYFNAFS